MGCLFAEQACQIDWECMARLSKEESRAIITRDVAFYVNYSKILPCYYLQTTLCTEQLAEVADFIDYCLVAI